MYEYAQQIAPSLTIMETLSHNTDINGDDAEIMELGMPMFEGVRAGRVRRGW